MVRCKVCSFLSNMILKRKTKCSLFCSSSGVFNVAEKLRKREEKERELAKQEAEEDGEEHEEAQEEQEEEKYFVKKASTASSGSWSVVSS